MNAGYTQEQQAEYKAQHDAIAQAVADLMVAGKEFNDEEVQNQIAKHYAFVKQFWTPSKQAYKSLEATYESFSPGLAKYIKSAIEIWADQNLD
jgi:MerR family transcriptional regulator, thiopeptide resistance regulator